MADKELMNIEVAYALQARQRIVAMRVPTGTPVRQALADSGIVTEFPEIDIRRCPIGVFGQVIADDYVMRDGDRIEIYRPLERDPREARRELAARGLTM